VSAVQIRIKDNGTGISETIAAKVFQPFFTTKPTGQGTGLGLSLSYDIVTKGHNGTLELITQENEGTEFIITIPV
jgi:two-component system NtrC family sensor kinase